MEKRIFTAVIISIAVLWLWAAVAPKLFPDLVKPRTNLNAPQKSAPTTTKPAAVSDTASAPPAARPVPPQPAAVVAPTSPIAATAITYTRIETDDYIVIVGDYDITNAGKDYRHNDFHIIPRGVIRQLTVLRDPSELVSLDVASAG